MRTLLAAPALPHDFTYPPNGDFILLRICVLPDKLAADQRAEPRGLYADDLLLADWLRPLEGVLSPTGAPRLLEAVWCHMGAGLAEECLVAVGPDFLLDLVSTLNRERGDLFLSAAAGPRDSPGVDISFRRDLSAEHNRHDMARQSLELGRGYAARRPPPRLYAQLAEDPAPHDQAEPLFQCDGDDVACRQL